MSSAGKEKFGNLDPIVKEILDLGQRWVSNVPV